MERQLSHFIRVDINKFGSRTKDEHWTETKLQTSSEQKVFSYVWKEAWVGFLGFSKLCCCWRGESLLFFVLSGYGTTTAAVALCQNLGIANKETIFVSNCKKGLLYNFHPSRILGKDQFERLKVVVPLFCSLFFSHLLAIPEGPLKLYLDGVWDEAKPLFKANRQLFFLFLAQL